MHRCGAGSAVAGKRCGGVTLGDDAVSGGITCAWDRSRVRWCGTGSAMVGMRCGGATLGADAGVCVAAVGSRRAEGARCTGARRTLGDGARGAGETSGTTRGDRGPAAESKIEVSWRMARRWSWPSVAKGAVGNWLARASIKLREACWASLAEDVWGMAQLWEKINGLGNAFFGRGQYVDAVEPIVLGGCANVLAVDAVTGPGVADGRNFMD